jgi:hypothetical protein
MPSASVEVLDEVVSVARESIQVPSTIIHRNPGISPFAMDALLALLKAKSSLDDLVPASPGSSDAASTLCFYRRALCEHNRAVNWTYRQTSFQHSPAYYAVDAWVPVVSPDC